MVLLQESQTEFVMKCQKKKTEGIPEGTVGETAGETPCNFLNYLGAFGLAVSGVQCQKDFLNEYQNELIEESQPELLILSQKKKTGMNPRKWSTSEKKNVEGVPNEILKKIPEVLLGEFQKLHLGESQKKPMVEFKRISQKKTHGAIAGGISKRDPSEAAVREILKYRESIAQGRFSDSRDDMKSTSQ